jgi:hypothetical protein
VSAKRPLQKAVDDLELQRLEVEVLQAHLDLQRALAVRDSVQRMQAELLRGNPIPDSTAAEEKWKNARRTLGAVRQRQRTRAPTGANSEKAREKWWGRLKNYNKIVQESAYVYLAEDKILETAGFTGNVASNEEDTEENQEKAEKVLKNNRRALQRWVKTFKDEELL